MRYIKFKIPVAGFIETTQLFKEEITKEEALEIVINNYNKTSKSSKLKKAMIQGSMIDFPLLFAEAEEVESP